MDTMFRLIDCSGVVLEVSGSARYVRECAARLRDIGETCRAEQSHDRGINWSPLV